MNKRIFIWYGTKESVWRLYSSIGFIHDIKWIIEFVTHFIHTNNIYCCIIWLAITIFTVCECFLVASELSTSHKYFCHVSTALYFGRKVFFSLSLLSLYMTYLFCCTWSDSYHVELVQTNAKLFHFDLMVTKRFALNSRLWTPNWPNEKVIHTEKHTSDVAHPYEKSSTEDRVGKSSTNLNHLTFGNV